MDGKIYSLAGFFLLLTTVVNPLLANTLTIRCERNSLFLGDIPNAQMAEGGLPTSSEFLINNDKFMTDSFGPILGVNTGNVRVRGNRYELRFSFMYQSNIFDYTMEYNSNSGSYQQTIYSRYHNLAVGGAQGDCRQI